MTNTALKRSLVFPIFNILSGIYFAILFLRIELPPLVVVPLICSFLGGLLPVCLTVKKQLDTSRYFISRMLFLIASFFIFTYPISLGFELELSGFYSASMRVPFNSAAFVPIPLYLFELLYFAFRTKSIKTTAAIMLSDPLGWDIFLFWGTMILILANKP